MYEDCFVYQAARAQFTPPLSPCKAEVEPQPRGDLLKRRRYEESIRGAPKRGSSGCNVVGIVKRYSRDELRAILKVRPGSALRPLSRARAHRVHGARGFIFVAVRKSDMERFFQMLVLSLV